MGPRQPESATLGPTEGLLFSCRRSWETFGHGSGGPRSLRISWIVATPYFHVGLLHTRLTDQIPVE
jgi:hypothetical protein